MSETEPQNEASYTLSRTAEDLLSSTLYTPAGEGVTPIDITTMWRVGWTAPLPLPYLTTRRGDEVLLMSPYNPPLWESAMMRYPPLALPEGNEFYGTASGTLFVQETPPPQPMAAALTVYPFYFLEWDPSKWTPGVFGQDESYTGTATRLMAGAVETIDMPDPRLEEVERDELWPVIAHSRDGERRYVTLDGAGFEQVQGFAYRRTYVEGTREVEDAGTTLQFSVGLNDGFYPPLGSFSSTPLPWRGPNAPGAETGTIIANGFSYAATRALRQGTRMPNYWAGVQHEGASLDGEVQVGEVLQFYDRRTLRETPVDPETGEPVGDISSYHLVTTARLVNVTRDAGGDILHFDRLVPVPFFVGSFNQPTDLREGPQPETWHTAEYKTSFYSNPGGTLDPAGTLDVSVEAFYTYEKQAAYLLAADVGGPYRVRYTPYVGASVSTGFILELSYNGSPLPYQSGIEYYLGVQDIGLGPPGSHFHLWAGPGGALPEALIRPDDDLEPFDLSFPAGGFVAETCAWDGPAAVPPYTGPSSEFYRDAAGRHEVVGGGGSVTKKLLLDDLLRRQHALGETLPDGVAECLNLTPETQAFYDVVNPVLCLTDDATLPNPLASRGTLPYWYGLEWPPEVRWYVCDAFSGLYKKPGEPVPLTYLFAVAIVETTPALTGERAFRVLVSLDREPYWEGDLADFFAASRDPDSGRLRLTFLDGRVWPEDGKPGVRPHFSFVHPDFEYRDEGNLAPFSARARNAKHDKGALKVPPPFEGRPCPLTLHFQESLESPLELPDTLPVTAPSSP